MRHHGKIKDYFLVGIALHIHIHIYVQINHLNKQKIRNSRAQEGKRLYFIRSLSPSSNIPSYLPVPHSNAYLPFLRFRFLEKRPFDCENYINEGFVDWRNSPNQSTGRRSLWQKIEQMKTPYLLETNPQ